MLIVLSLLLGFASISTDLFLPALPAMSVALNASEGALQLTISAYLLGFAIGQLFWGPVSDRYGRRGAGYAWHHGICGWLGRMRHGDGRLADRRLARGASARRQRQRRSCPRHGARPLWPRSRRQIAVDADDGHGHCTAARSEYRSTDPSYGLMARHLLDASGDRSCHRCRRLHSARNPAPGKTGTGPLRLAFAGYGTLISNRQLLGYSAAIGFFSAGVFAMVAGTPFAYISYHHVSPQVYGLLFASGIIGLMITNVINARLVTRFGSNRMLLVGTIGATLSGATVALVTGTGWGGIFGLVVAVFLFTSMNGFILANAVAGALASTPTRTGAASAVVGAIQYGSGMIGSALIGVFADGTPWPMGCVIALAGIGSLISAVLAGGHHQH